MNRILPARRRPKPMKVRESSMIRCRGHLQWVRGHECAVGRHLQIDADSLCDLNPSEAAHARTGTDGGTSLKPSDSWALPLCPKHHREQHRIGEPAFERRYGIDMKEIAAELWRVSPHRPKYMKALAEQSLSPDTKDR